MRGTSRRWTMVLLAGLAAGVGVAAVTEPTDEEVRGGKAFIARATAPFGMEPRYTLLSTGNVKGWYEPCG